MTTYHLKFWSKSCDSADVSRVYVNADDRSTLGYFERRENMAARGNSYYDQHRASKGDTVKVISDVYYSTVPTEIAELIFAAPAICAHITASKMNDDFSRFDALQSHCRGMKFYASNPKASKALEAEANAFTIEI